MACSRRSSSEDATYAMPQVMHRFCTCCPRLICIWVKEAVSGLIVSAAGLFFGRTLSLVSVRGPRFPKTEKAFFVGRGGLVIVRDLPLGCSQGKPGGEDGGLAGIAGSSEKMAWSRSGVLDCVASSEDDMVFRCRAHGSNWLRRCPYARCGTRSGFPGTRRVGPYSDVRLAAEASGFLGSHTTLSNHLYKF